MGVQVVDGTVFRSDTLTQGKKGDIDLQDAGSGDHTGPMRGGELASACTNVERATTNAVQSAKLKIASKEPVAVAMIVMTY